MSYLQCLEEPATLELYGLDPRRLHRADRLQDPNKTHLVNITKVTLLKISGVECSDKSWTFKSKFLNLNHLRQFKL
jgi:hypothetical protein